MSKLTKEAVNYRKMTGIRRCDNCSMYRAATLAEVLEEAEDLCTLVEGRIAAHFTCDRWDRRA